MTIATVHTSRRLNITLWIVQVLVALFFIGAAAIPKLLGDPTAVRIFEQIGGDWFRYLTGSLEFAGALGLLIPPLAGLGALGLTGVMIGATITQLAVLDGPAGTSTPIALGIVLALIAWGRWPRTKALLHGHLSGDDRLDTTAT